jgi:hypothetical protein
MKVLALLTLCAVTTAPLNESARGPQVRRRLLLVLAALVLGFAYLIASTYFAGVAAALAFPTWRLLPFSKPAASMLIWMAFLDVVAVVLISLPFAWVFGRLYGRLGVLLAFATTAAVCALITIPSGLHDFAAARPRLQAIWLFETAVRLVALPAAVWVFRIWSSKYQLERTQS